MGKSIILIIHYLHNFMNRLLIYKNNTKSKDKKKITLPFQKIYYKKKRNFCIPKIVFSRIIRSLLERVSPSVPIRIQVNAIETLQLATEHYLTKLLEDAYVVHCMQRELLCFR